MIASLMIFTKKNAGKWVASKGEKVIATSKTLKALAKKVEARKDKNEIAFDLVPKYPSIAGFHGVRLYENRG